MLTTRSRFAAVPLLIGCGLFNVQAGEFSAPSVGAIEGSGFLSLEVLRNGDLSAPASLPWRLLPGTATSPADYSGPLSGQMDFAAREGSRVLQVPLTPDALEEPDVSASGK